jgi:lambda family phage portal protein
MKNWFDRFIAEPISPRWALQRAMDRHRLRVLRAYYEAAEPGQHHKWRTDRRSANTINERAMLPIRTQARHLEENYDLATGVLDVLVSNTVGTGIQPEPQVMLLNGDPAEDVNRALLKIYDDWIHTCEVTRQHGYYGWQRIMARSWFRDGEVFAQRIIGNVPGLEHGTALPYSLEGLEADFVPSELHDFGRGIRQGVEVNAWGKPRGYWVYKNHPGDLMAGGFGPVTTLQTKRVSADTMMHLAVRKRLHQLRGISVFASTLNRFDDIKEIDENERIAARVASSMAAYIKKGQPDVYEPPDADENGDVPRRQLFMQAGIIFDDLRPGEDVGTIDTTRPNNDLIPFRDANMRAVSAGTGAGSSSTSKNYNGSYAAQRQELVEQFTLYRSCTGDFVFRICQPTWDSLIDAVLISGAVRIGPNVDRSTLYDCTHTAPPIPWIDPEKEVKAKILKLRWGFASRPRIIREFGDNPDQINREIVRDQREVERLGVRIIGDGDGLDEEEDETPQPPRRNGDARNRVLNRRI